MVQSADSLFKQQPEPLPCLSSNRCSHDKDLIAQQNIISSSESDNRPKSSASSISQEPSESGKSQKKQKQKNKEYVNFFKLYRYASQKEYLLICLGVLLSAGTGCGLPFFAVVSGKMIDAFNESGIELTNQTAQARNLFLIIGFSTFVAAWLSIVVWMELANRIAFKCREKFIERLLSKQGQWFERKVKWKQQLSGRVPIRRSETKPQQRLAQQYQVSHEELISSFEQHTRRMTEALGLKVGTFIFIAASLVAGGRNAISTGWLLSVVMVSTLPLLGLSGVLYSLAAQFKRSKLVAKYVEAAEDQVKWVFDSEQDNLRMVKSFNAQEHEYRMFEASLGRVQQDVWKYSLFLGFGAGWFTFVQFGVYALAFWFGSHCVEGTAPCQSPSEDDKYTPGQVIVIFFAFYVRLDSMQQILPTLKAIFSGMESAYWIYGFIDCVEQSLATLSPSQTGDNKAQEDEMKDMNLYELSTPQQHIHQTSHPIFELKNVTLKEKNSGSLRQKDLIMDSAATSVFQKMSFTMDRSNTALLGGQDQKMAITDLLKGFTKVNSGQVYVDSIPLEKGMKSELLKKIAYLDESTPLWSFSLQENLLYQKASPDDLLEQTDQIGKWGRKKIISILKGLGTKQTHFLEDYLLNKNGECSVKSLEYLGNGLKSDQAKRVVLLTRLILQQPSMIFISSFCSPLPKKEELELFVRFLKLCQEHYREDKSPSNLHSVPQIIYSGNNQQIMKQMSRVVFLGQYNSYEINKMEYFQNMRMNKIQSEDRLSQQPDGDEGLFQQNQFFKDQNAESIKSPQQTEILEEQFIYKTHKSALLRDIVLNEKPYQHLYRLSNLSIASQWAFVPDFYHLPGRHSVGDF